MISWLTVEATRSRCLAISGIDEPEALANIFSLSKGEG
jgi:hypothetical protein